MAATASASSHLVAADRHEFVPLRWGGLALDLGQQPHDLPPDLFGVGAELGQDLDGFVGEFGQRLSISGDSSGF